jgi:hypothetical protein
MFSFLLLFNLCVLHDLSFLFLILFTLIHNVSWVDLNLIPGENLDLYTTLFNPNLESLRAVTNEIILPLVKGKDS